MRNLVKRIIVIALISLGLVAIGNNTFASKLYSPEASSLYYQGLEAYRTRHFTLATNTFKEIIEKYPEDGYADLCRFNLAYLYRDLKEYDLSIAMFKEVIANNQNLSDVYKARTDLSDVLYSIHRYREGIELLETWMRAEPNNSDYARKLASFYFQSGGKNEAWLLLERFVALGSEAAFKDLLSFATVSGEIDKLINSLEGIRNKIKQNLYLSFVADCYLALGRKDQAIESIKEYNDYVKDTVLLRKLADIEISANRQNDAIKTLEMLIKFTPSDWQTLRKLGHCYFLKGDKENAYEIWRRPLSKHFNVNQEGYMRFTSVLIEHQMLLEALEAFDEARSTLHHGTLFAEEKAAVLEALNRKAEAMEEYLNVLEQGMYKAEIFQKLFAADGADFPLEQRLISLNESGYNNSIIQALLEYYFKKARNADIDKMLALFKEESAIFLDDLFYNRLRQEALLVPENFHYNLMKSCLKLREDSSLELKLAILMLRMPDYNQKWLKESYEIAKKTANSERVADPELKYDLFLKLADFAFTKMHSPKEADEFLSNILKRNLIKPYKGQILEAMLYRTKLYTYMGDFEKAEELLTKVNEVLDKASFDNNYSRLDREEFVLQALLEKARIQYFKGQYQEALYALKEIIDNHKEGEWVNDALDLSLGITRYSLGDFSLLKHKSAYEAFVACGKKPEALEEINKAIKIVPASATAILEELEVEKLMLESENKHAEAAIKNLDLFMAKHPDCHRNPDLSELKIKLMEEKNYSEDRINEEMRTFINTFPTDLRSGKYKQSLEMVGSK